MRKSSAPAQTQTVPPEPRPSPAHSSVKEPSVDLLNTVAEKLEKVKDVTEYSTEHKNLLNTVAQKLVEAKDTVAEKVKETKEYVEREATVVNDMLRPVTGE
ncbi:unnamed protein product [Cylicocyclus nassatus]|uniref:Uncharacterized protein n=1 Tax=Cylicocyclus nassatus TaxID=53992 RepID=A0AA36HAT4_CYLNA|nr:unnamed protein product [Cylicocyclus nassatus]